MPSDENTQEILEAIHAFASNVDGRFVHLEKELKEFVDERIARSQHEMKDFVDRRITDAVAEIAPAIRKVDEKDSALVDRLADAAVVPPSAAATIKALSPFAT